MPTPSEDSIRTVRAELLARTDLVGGQLRAALTSLYDGWLHGLTPQIPGIALMSVGGLGRREPTPYSDLDLVLLHTGKQQNISSIADGLWYPVWDSGIGLDHSVRTVEEATAVAAGDLKAMLGMLDARHIAGDPALTGLLREQVISNWRRTAAKRLTELQELARSRWTARGDASFLLEPDLKDCRGGLRDWVGLRALASAQLLDLTPAVVQASGVLLDVRGELHRLTGRSAEVLRAQDRQSVADALGIAGDAALPAADAVLRSANEAARVIAYATDAAWRRVAASTRPAERSWIRRLRPAGLPDPNVRTPLARDVVSQGGEVVLARDADPWADPVLLLRVARAAAGHDLPISSYALSRLVTESSPMPEPWPADARTEFIALLGAGRRSVAPIEALDQHGLMSRLMPEWEHVRYRAQHNPVHRFTVDRHLIETSVQASSLASEVNRPDLLLLGALLHDIGKGLPGDHSVVGAVLAQRIAARMGFNAADVAMIQAQARHHLLLPDTATRRDLDDPSTTQLVVSAIDGSAELLDLLHVLTIADAAATGPAAWSDWKAALIRQLVSRTRALIGGETLPAPEPLSRDLSDLAVAGQTRVVIAAPDVIVVAPDAPGLLSRTAGLLALHSLDVQAADVRTVDRMAVNRFTVSPRFGEFPDQAVLNADLRRILAGNLELAERLRAKEALYDRRSAAEATGPEQPIPLRVLWFDDEATDATVMEVRTRDGIGLLHWVTSALEEAGVDIRSARISSLGSYVVDAFYVTDANGKALDEAKQAEVASAMTLALAPGA
jgi:[protein-PII] uridylyltransferase